MGLDVATKTGFSILEDGNIIDYGVITLSDKDDHRTRFLEFKKKMTILLKKYKPDMVVIEETYVGPNVKITAYLNMLRGILIACIPSKTKFKSGVVSNIRKETLGAGKKHTKEEVFDCMTKKYNIKNLNKKKDLDITDSILLVDWGNLTILEN